MNRVAFYAPMKSPNHPTPSGDRQIARLTLRAIAATGAAPFVASSLRTLDMAGDTDAQDRLYFEADREISRLVRQERNAKAWFTYHCYYKAPDLIGPAVAEQLHIPYLVSEPSYSPRRLNGPWARFAKTALLALEQADILLWTTPRDTSALREIVPEDRLTHLPAFTDIGPEPQRQPGPPGVLRLLTVAMMRPGDKLASYRALASALDHLDGAWKLTIVGDGSERAAVEALFEKFSTRVSFKGQISDRGELRAQMEAHDVFVWPGIGEGVGMVYLEAQAAGLPVMAENHPGPRAVIASDPLPAPQDPAAFVTAICNLAADPQAPQKARAYVVQNHSLKSASRDLETVFDRVWS